MKNEMLKAQTSQQLFPGKLNPPGSIAISLPEFSNQKNSIALVAYGRHFVEMGIIDGSLLICRLGMPVKDGDLAIVYKNAEPYCKLVCSNPAEAPEGVPVVVTGDTVVGKVMATLNRYL